MTAIAPADPSTAPVALLFPDMATEYAMTRQLLAIVPWDKADWKPHPKSMSLRSLASHVAQLPGFVTAMVALDVLDFKPEDFAAPPLNSTEELVAMFDRELAKMHEVMTSLDWSRLDENWQMKMGPHTIIDNQRAYLIRHMGVNHLVHHRAQLGVYLRLLDVAIPGAYGPSADTAM